MALWQAIICGIFYYLNAGPWVCGIGFYTFGRPMVLGFFVGLILGDPITGTIVGATIQMIYLGLMTLLWRASSGQRRRSQRDCQHRRRSLSRFLSA